MRTIKVVEEDHTRLRVNRDVCVVDRPTEPIAENELVNVVFLDGTHMAMKPIKSSDTLIHRCEKCCLWSINRCCAFKYAGDYVCLFRGMPAKSIDALLEDL